MELLTSNFPLLLHLKCRHIQGQSSHTLAQSRQHRLYRYETKERQGQYRIVYHHRYRTIILLNVKTFYCHTPGHLKLVNKLPESIRIKRQYEVKTRFGQKVTNKQQLESQERSNDKVFKHVKEKID